MDFSISLQKKYMNRQENTKKMISINSICTHIHFGGEQALDFLNNLLISDLKNLTKDKFYFSALCNPKGRVIASFWLKIHENDDISLVCASNMLKQLQQFFIMRRFRLKITIAQKQSQITLKNNTEIVIEDSNKAIKLIETTPEIAKIHYYNYLFQQDLAWIDAENTEKFIPQHINYDKIDKTMSFSKGCYPGQEIIARIKYLGTIKKRMMLLSDKNRDHLLATIEKDEVVSPIIKIEDNFFVQVVRRVN